MLGKSLRSGNILKEIWLNKRNVEKAYIIANRVDIKQQNNILLEYLEQYQFNQKWIEDYRKDMISYISEKHKTNSLFPYEYAKDILKVLKEIDNKKEVLKRVLSINCFGVQEDDTNEEILLEVGISKYPEVLEFCGDLEYYIKNEKIEYKKETIRKLYK